MSAIKDRLDAPKAAQTLNEQILSELQHLNATSTEMMARLHGGQILNNVLEVVTLVIPSAGFVSRDYPVAIGSVIVINPGTHAMTYQVGGPAASAPSAGTGVQPVPANTWLAIPVGSTQLTIYGTAGDSVSLQVFTGLTAFGAGTV